MGMGVAMTSYAAQNAGAHQPRRILVGVRDSLLLAIGFCVVLGVGIVLAGPGLVSIFVGDGAPDVVRMAHEYLVINAALYSVLVLLVVVRSAIQRLSVTLAPTVSGVCQLAARGSIGLWMVDKVGFIGVILAGPFAWAARAHPRLVVVVLPATAARTRGAG